MASPMTFTVEGAQIIFKNFAGEGSPMNAEGNRNFCVILDPDVAEAMAQDGWNVKYLSAREEGDEDVPYIQVAVGYKVKPPHVVMITSGGRVPLDESMIETLDWADFRNVDLIAQASNWKVGDKSGVKAYLKTMFVEIEEDELQKKYAEYEHPEEG